MHIYSLTQAIYDFVPEYGCVCQPSLVPSAGSTVNCFLALNGRRLRGVGIGAGCVQDERGVGEESRREKSPRDVCEKCIGYEENDCQIFESWGGNGGRHKRLPSFCG